MLNSRTLFGLPRKFNVAFDGGGSVAALEDTNDIGFQAVEVVNGGGVDPGIWFRLLLGGITGHKDFARSTGLYLKPEEATEIADAIVRIFIDHGDRTDRAKARLKYLLDAWGFDKFVAGDRRPGSTGTLPRIPEDRIKDRPRPDRMAVGVHRAEAARRELDRRGVEKRPSERRRRCKASSRIARDFAAMAISA